MGKLTIDQDREKFAEAWGEVSDAIEKRKAGMSAQEIADEEIEYIENEIKKIRNIFPNLILENYNIEEIEKKSQTDPYSYASLYTCLYLLKGHQENLQKLKNNYNNRITEIQKQKDNPKSLWQQFFEREEK
jgi:hypothetical protein